MKKVLFTIIILLILLFLYGRYIEPKNIKIKEYTINSSDIPESFEELKIVHFSDILYNKDETRLDKIKEKINSLKPDVLIFSGDLFSNDFTYKENDFNNLKNFLKSLDASLYKYAVIGDNDEKYLDKYKDILYDANFILLDNESTLLFYKDVTPINIIGITNKTDINELLNAELEYNYSLVITHKPDIATSISLDNIDTIIAGHSLGGVINIPYEGGLIKKSGANTYINDYYKIDNTELYISNGLGYETFEFRLFNSPTINVYRFKLTE